MEETKKIIGIPNGVEVSVLEGSRVEIKGEKGSLVREISHPKISIKKDGSSIEVRCQSSRRKDLAMLGTCAAHISNMIKGVSQGFEYKMKVVYSHFPIKTTVEEDRFLIHNFLGERTPRIAKILEGVEVEIRGEEIIVRGADKEKVGQTVANIERATRVKDRDIRVFQDGIYRVSRG
jgi:large subunit ribosomal protein L6